MSSKAKQTENTYKRNDTIIVKSLDHDSIICKDLNIKDRSFKHFVSSDNVDRVGDIIRQKGLSWKNYDLKGKPVLYGHQSHVTGTFPVIGMNTMRVIENINGVDKTLVQTKLFKLDGNPIANDILSAMEQGYKQPSSIGIIAIADALKDLENNGREFLKSEVDEYSLVWNPAHVDATQIEKYFKNCESTEYKSILAEYNENKSFGDNFENLQDEFNKFYKEVNKVYFILNTQTEKMETKETVDKEKASPEMMEETTETDTLTLEDLANKIIALEAKIEELGTKAKPEDEEVVDETDETEEVDEEEKFYTQDEAITELKKYWDLIDKGKVS